VIEDEERVPAVLPDARIGNELHRAVELEQQRPRLLFTRGSVATMPLGPG